MKDKLTCFERRIETLMLLIRRGKTTIPELAQYFSVCNHTAYNDIVFLSKYAPIYTKNGVHGGVFLLKDYHNHLFHYLSKSEECLLTDIMEQLEGSNKMIVQNILIKFSMLEANV